VSRRILRPLGLRDTYFEGADPVIRGPHMHAYVPWPPDGTPRDFTRYNMSWLWASGDLVSTAHDLNTFYRALLTGKLLNRRLLAEMKTTVPRDPDVPEAAGYGLGLLVDR
jgi:D-alanyl-D-alanine carboxypeptidase